MVKQADSLLVLGYVVNTVGGLTPSNFANCEVFIPNRLRSLVTAAAVGVKAFLLFLIGFFLTALVFRWGFTGSSMSTPKTSERSAPASQRRFPSLDVAV